MSESKGPGGVERGARRAGRFVGDFRRLYAAKSEAERSTEPPFDPTSWSGAIALMAGFGAVLWIVEIINHANHQRLDRFGLLPRHVDGLWGILVGPFLHESYAHLFSNTVPVLLIGWVLLLSGVRIWIFVTVVVTLLGGAAAWVVAPADHLIVGSSSLVFGWMGYLIARAVFSRRLKWIVTAAALLVFFGTLLGSLLPSVDKHSTWQSNVCGFAAGAFVGWLLHPRHKQRAVS